jgi:hypothetical protein
VPTEDVNQARGTSSSLPENGTIGTAYISTGGGSPGSNVRGQCGYRDALLNNNRREEEEELNPTNILQIGRTGWQGSSQVKNKEVVVDSEGSLRWRRRKRRRWKRKGRRRKWC